MSYLEMQPSNPTEKSLDQLETRIEFNNRQMDDLRREIRALERQNDDLASELEERRANNYVFTAQGETLEEHLADVEYHEGYYETVALARTDAMAEMPEGFQIMDLNGKIVEAFPCTK